MLVNGGEVEDQEGDDGICDEGSVVSFPDVL